ncbi:MAG: histidinol-phosphatase HisJ family protein [Clostridiales bacterium]|nr:histidinol-phosphatase HisJ family protein [Clostridiales bacterium]
MECDKMTDYKNLIDMHTHTDNSFDGNHSPVYMCEAACNKSLRAIAFTDHCEVDAYYKDNGERNVRQAYFEIAKAKSAFMGKILVLNGIELGQPAYDTETADKIISSQRFDIVLGSVHNLRNRQDFYFVEDFSKTDIKKDMREYFDEILIMLQWGKFDVLAHLTYPFRYLYSKNHIRENINDYKDQVDEILKLAAEKDMALEINTAGLRKPINRLSPEIDTVKRFKELGGKLISIGSDAHYAQHLAVGIKTAMDTAKEAGFDAVTLFQHRHAMEIPIE